MDGYPPTAPMPQLPGAEGSGPPPLAQAAIGRRGTGSRLLAGLHIQLTVIGALMMREIHTRFGRHHMGYMWLFFEPMILGGCIAAVHTISGHGLPGGLDVASFYIVGYTPYYLFRSILNRAAGSLHANAPLFYHRQVTFLDIMLSRNLLDCASVMIALLIMMGLLGAMTGQWPQDLVWMAVGIMMITAFCHGMALIFVSATVWGTEAVERFVHPFTYLTIPVTGAFFMVFWFPTELQELALMIPTVHMFEIIREGQFGPVVPFHYDVFYVMCWILALNLIGMMALRVAKTRLDFT